MSNTYISIAINQTKILLICTIPSMSRFD